MGVFRTYILLKRILNLKNLEITENNKTKKSIKTYFYLLSMSNPSSISIGWLSKIAKAQGITVFSICTCARCILPTIFWTPIPVAKPSHLVSISRCKLHFFAQLALNIVICAPVSTNAVKKVVSPFTTRLKNCSLQTNKRWVFQLILEKLNISNTLQRVFNFMLAFPIFSSIKILN